MPEECQREVQVLARDEPPAAELGGLPGRQLVEDVAGKAKRAEEAETFIALHASAHFRT
jgi:hypothetical protein